MALLSLGVNVMPKLFAAPKPTSNKPDCGSCQLCTVVKSPCLKFLGEGRTHVLIIGTAPSTKDDDKGDLGHGTEYSFLQQTLEDMGYDLERDFYYTTIVGCKLPRNRAPTKKEIKQCSPRIKSLIKRLEPKALLLLGESAFDGIIGERISGRLTGTPAAKFYGDAIPDQEMGIWLCPTWGIKELLSTRSYDDGNQSKPLYERDKAHYNYWKDHITQAVEKAQESFDIIDYAQQCHITQDIDQAVDWIEEAMDWSHIAFDYETDGIKAHRKGHRIYSVSLSNGIVSYSFPFFDDTFFRKVFKRLMTMGKKLICHNASYEWQWTNELLGYWPTEMYWDTMLSQHCLNSNKPTGLKYCTYASTGVVGYDSDAEEWLKSNKEDADKYGNNAFNRIFEGPKEKILLYNAEDSLFTFIIYKKHKSRLSEFQMQGMSFLMESTLCLAKTSANGFMLDTKRLEEVKHLLEEKIEQAKKDIMDSEEVKLWDDPDKIFNFDSSTQLGHLLYDILKLKPPFYTDGGKPSVDAEALEKLQCPLVEKILYQRKLKKLLGTYISQYGVEAVDGIIHPQFLLNSVVSFRSSCNAVNVQNLPKRDKEAKQLITSLVIPRPGRKIIAYDYKAIEIAVNACYSRDKNLIDYVNDPSKDMHRDSVMDIFMMEKDEVTKPVRSGIKSAFVFAEWYGSYYKQTAPDCWELAKQYNLIDHLAKKGIKDYPAFEDRVKHAEEILWGERFARHADWCKEKWKEYQKKGFIDTYDGFRLYGPMNRNLSRNSSPQGSAYHCLQWTMNQMQKEIEKRGLKSLLIFEIHDAAYFDAVPEEEPILDKLMYEYGIVKIKEQYPWICVNFQMEKETGPVGANWSELKEAGYITGGEING
jgi:uracil-DNA glycosylase family 4